VEHRRGEIPLAAMRRPPGSWDGETTSDLWEEELSDEDALPPEARPPAEEVPPGKVMQTRGGGAKKESSDDADDSSASDRSIRTRQIPKRSAARSSSSPSLTVRNIPARPPQKQDHERPVVTLRRRAPTETNTGRPEGPPGPCLSPAVAGGPLPPPQSRNPPTLLPGPGPSDGGEGTWTRGGGEPTVPDYGTLGIVYIQVNSKASMLQVAADLRAGPGQVVMATCGDGDVAASLAQCLAHPPEVLASYLLGGGGEGVQGEDTTQKRTEHQFVVKTSQTLLVAGRLGIVDDVEVREELSTAMGGTLMIADLSLNKQICHQMSLRVAVWHVTSCKPTEKDPEPEVTGTELSWDNVREILKKTHSACSRRRPRLVVVADHEELARKVHGQFGRVGALQAPFGGVHGCFELHARDRAHLEAQDLPRGEESTHPW
jgi:hypothetical protein